MGTISGKYFDRLNKYEKEEERRKITSGSLEAWGFCKVEERLYEIKPKEFMTKSKEGKVTEKEFTEELSKRRKYMLKIVRDTMFETYEWLLELNNKGVLTDEDVRNYVVALRDAVCQANEKLRHEKAMEFIPIKEMESMIDGLGNNL